MKKKTLIFLAFIVLSFPFCRNVTDEILPVGDMDIFLEGIEFQSDLVVISLRFKELMGIETRVTCLITKFMKDGIVFEADDGYFTPSATVPRYGEISWIQEIQVTGAYKDADSLRIIIQLQTEFFKGYHVSKDFNIEGLF